MLGYVLKENPPTAEETFLSPGDSRVPLSALGRAVLDAVTDTWPQHWHQQRQAAFWRPKLRQLCIDILKDMDITEVEMTEEEWDAPWE